MTRYLSKMTTIAFYVLLVFLFIPNDASTENLKPHKIIIYNLKQNEIGIIMNFLTLREALGLRIASKIFQTLVPKIAKEDEKYLKPFLNYGYDKNIGFVLSKYCFKLNKDSYELRDINANILQPSGLKLYFNSYAFVLGLGIDLVLFGGIGEYKEKIPTKIIKGGLYNAQMNKRAIVAVLKVDRIATKYKLFTIGDPAFYTDDVTEKIQQENSLVTAHWVPLCTANICSFWNIFTDQLYSWGDFLGENEIPPPKEILENAQYVTNNNQAVGVVFRDRSVAAWGNPMFGGEIPENTKHLLTNIDYIRKTDGAFAAISVDRKVYAWGHPLFGGEIPEHMQPLLQNIKFTRVTARAFAALKYDGNVYAWGNSDYGGKIPEEIQPLLQNIQNIVSNEKAFAALTNDGNVFAWGDPNYGGSPSEEIRARLYNVRRLHYSELQGMKNFSIHGQFMAEFNDDRGTFSWP